MMTQESGLLLNELEMLFTKDFRMEEMYRMREHVSKQMDKNGDRLISLEEFLHDTEAQANDGKDEGWKDLGQEQVNCIIIIIISLLEN